MDKSRTDAAVADSNRRVDPRYPSAVVSSITGIRLSPGESVSLVNISASGVLAEGKTRLVPGTRVTVHFEGGAVKPPQIKARVVRCQVSAISGGLLQYQSAIAFEGRVELPVEESALPIPQVPAPIDEPMPPKKGKAPAAAGPAAPRVFNRW